MTTISFKVNELDSDGSFGPFFGTFYKADGSEYTSIGMNGDFSFPDNTVFPFDEDVSLSAGEWEFTYYQLSESTFEYYGLNYSILIGDDEIVFDTDDFSNDFYDEYKLGTFEVRRTFIVPDMTSESITVLPVENSSSSLRCPAWKKQVRGAIHQDFIQREAWGQV